MNVNSKTIKRLVKDVSDIYKNPIVDNGIHYVHDDENMLLGYALIIGPKGTIYQHGYYFFEFKFTKSYPFDPPKVIFHTRYSDTRFHPNFYRNGKVCLSILNTWKGECWTACQSIKSILLTLVSLFETNSLLHEPGIHKDNIEVQKYNKIIEYINYKHSHLQLSNNYELGKFSIFKHIINKETIANSSDMVSILLRKKENVSNEHVSCKIYDFSVHVNYSILFKHYVHFLSDKIENI